MTTTAPEVVTPGSGERVRRLRGGLRRRILLIFTLGSAVLALLLAGATYALTRSNVVQQTENAGIEATRRNARTVQNNLRGPTPSAQPAIDALESLGVQRALIWSNDQWWAASNRYQSSALPQALVDRVIDDVVPARMINEVDGEPHVVIGWPLEEGAAYFEFFTLDEVSTTLQSVQLSLYLAGGITIALAIVAGVVLSRRAVRPVADAAMAAKAIAGGRLETRLATTADPDLGALADSFNEMARALQERIERDARFASDVSHELRSPLMTLAASIEVIEGRRDEMPDRARAAVDLLSSDVARFRTLVEDLLEISRFDAGAISPTLDELLTAEFVAQAVAVSSLPETEVIVDERAASTLITGDRRRLARVIANLIDNARIHGGGSASVHVGVPSADAEVSRVRIEVSDDGPGVPDGERRRIFGRFARGGVAGRRRDNDGAGLGLALVAEHVRLHSGSVWVETGRRGSGSTFVIELPAEDLGDDS